MIICDLVKISNASLIRSEPRPSLPELIEATGKDMQWYQRVDAPPSLDPLTETLAVSGAVLDNVARTRTVTYVVADRADVSAMKAAAKAKAKADCEAKRAAYLSPGDGKMLEYREKAAEVERWDAGTLEHTAANFPLLAATRDGRGLADLATAHALIKATLDAWRVVGAAVCKAEDKATVAIGNATDGAAVRAAMATLASDLAAV